MLSKFGFKKYIQDFNKKDKTPFPGEKWGFISNSTRIAQKENGDPWASDEDEKIITGHTVTILDVKNGWVRYAWNNSRLFQDERQKISVFVHLYQKINEIDILKYNIEDITPSPDALSKIAIK